MARWDWYQGTIHGLDVDEVAAGLSRRLRGQVVPGRGMNGYSHGAEVQVQGEQVCTIWWGGNPGVHVKATGERSPAVAQALRDLGQHEVTRADACEDFVEPGLFDRLSRYFLDFAIAQGIKVNQVGDWHRGEARTLYLGSKASPVRLVMYEKGYQVGGDPDWVRLEVRVRPKGSGRELVSRWVPGQAFGASRWLSDMLAGIGWDHLVAQSVGTVWRPKDAERARQALARQYGPTLLEWAAELGSWSEVGQALGELLGAQREDIPEAHQASTASARPCIEV